MSKKLITVVMAILMVALLSACVPNPYQSVRQISAGGEGEVYLVPDLAYVYVGVRSQAENVADALSQNNEQAQAVSQTLSELGVEPKDIQTTAFNITPQQEYGPNGEVLRTVYVVENTVYVTLRDLQRLGELLDQVVRSGANSINGVSFDVSNREEATAEARRLAVEEARLNAEAMAQAAGVEVGELQSLSVYTNVPVPMYENKGVGGQAMSGAPVAAGQLVITANASASYAIK